MTKILKKLRQSGQSRQAFVSRPPRQKNKQTPPTSAFKGLTSSQLRKLQKEN